MHLANRKQSAMKKNNAMFISIEGMEGVGKSTAVVYLHELLTKAKVSHHVTREPGGTEIAEAIRQILLRSFHEPMAIETELLLMFAGRSQHIEQVIKPALAGGDWVLCDRFVDASYAYQGGGRGLPAERIAMLDQWLLGDLKPDLTILLDAPVEVGMARVRQRGGFDRIEQEKPEFFNRVRTVYLDRAKKFPERFRLVDTNCRLDQVQQQLATIIEELLDR